MATTALRHRLPRLLLSSHPQHLCCARTSSGGVQGAAAAPPHQLGCGRGYSSTPPSRGGIHMKNQPVLGWRLKRELDAKNKAIREKEAAAKAKAEERWMQEEMAKLTKDPDYFPDQDAIRLHKWRHARKKVDVGRLFGPYPQPPPPRPVRPPPPQGRFRGTGLQFGRRSVEEGGDDPGAPVAAEAVVVEARPVGGKP